MRYGTLGIYWLILILVIELSVILTNNFLILIWHTIGQPGIKKFLKLSFSLFGKVYFFLLDITLILVLSTEISRKSEIFVIPWDSLVVIMYAVKVIRRVIRGSLILTVRDLIS